MCHISDLFKLGKFEGLVLVNEKIAPRLIAAVCRRHDVPLAAAALQFPLGHRSVASVIPGPRATEEVRGNLAWMRRDIPDELWAELKTEGLIRPDAPTPRQRGSA